MMDALAWQAGARLVGWALLHSVWQGALVGGLYAVLRVALPRGNARYLLGVLALIVLALCPVLTGVALWQRLAPAAGGSAVALPDLSVGGAATTGANQSWLDAIVPWCALAWSCGVLTLSVRAWRQWRQLQLVLRLAERLPEWERRARGLARQFGLRRPVTIWRSALVATPALIGWLRPVVVLPVAMLGTLSVAQIEWLLAHELAHLRRWDPLCNLFQLVLETLYFHHPVVHWISRDVRNEREICCDALALAVRGGDRLDFARALAGLAGLREQQAPLLLAANGGLLLERVQRLVAEPTRHDPNPARPLVMAMGLLLAIVAASMAWRAPLQTLPRIAPLIGRPLLDAPMSSWSLMDLLPVRAQAVRPRPQPEAVTLEAIPTGASAMALPVSLAATLRVADLATPVRQALRLPAPAAAEAALPTVLHMRQPVYPQDAYDRGVEGRVVMEFGIGADGQVRDLRVVEANPAGTFDHAALRAMRDWQFAGSSVAGAARYRQAMVFSLRTAGHVTGESIDARIGCRVVTGTHICRLPEQDRWGEMHVDTAATTGLR